MNWIRTLGAALMGTSLVALLVLTPARAHEGHDDGPAATTATSAVGLVVRSAENDRLELVCKYLEPAPGQAVTVHFYLSDVHSNVPLEGATLDLSASSDDHEVAGGARPIEPGIYDANLIFPVKGSYLMRVKIGGSPGSANLILRDLDIGFLKVGAASANLAGKGFYPSMVPWILLGVLGLGVLVLVIRRVRIHGSAPLAILCIGGTLTLLLTAGPLRAHEGHDQGPQVSTTGGAKYMAKESQFLLGVRTLPAVLRPLNRRISALGHVVPGSGATATVASPQSGRLEQAGRMPAIGEHVTQGQILAYVTVIDRLPIRAPRSGTVAEIKFTTGQFVQAGQELATILDGSRVRIEVPLFGESLSEALTARMAEVTSPALPGTVFEARVTGTAPLLQEGANGQTVPVLLGLSNPRGLLRPGMQVQASLLLPSRRPTVVVPQSAVIRLESGPILFIHTAPETFELRPVQLGDESGSQVAVTQGLKEGERVVITGAPSLVAAPAIRGK